MAFCLACGAQLPPRALRDARIGSPGVPLRCGACGELALVEPSAPLDRTLPLSLAAPNAPEGSELHDTIREAVPPGSVVSRTRLGGAGAPARDSSPSQPAPREGSDARPTPSGPPDRDPPKGYRPFGEIGETANVVEVARKRGQRNPLGKARIVVSPDLRAELQRGASPNKRGSDLRARGRKGPRSRTPLVVGVALGLLVGAFTLVASRLPHDGALTASVRGGDHGGDVLELRCASCPDGTVARWKPASGGDALETRLARGSAALPLPTSLPLGDSSVNLEVVEPEGARRAESLEVRVPYRVRPELAAFARGEPAIVLAIEAIPGSQVLVAGESVPLGHGRGSHRVDVSAELTGPSNDATAQLDKRIAFEVVAPDGQRERGLAAVAIGIVPLELDVQERVVTTEPTFVLSGRTAPGARLHVAEHELPVDAGGRFSQSMSVSAVGTTRIEVRASQPGRAPRKVLLTVERAPAVASASPKERASPKATTSPKGTPRR
jgi:hypothetical protein